MKKIISIVLLCLLTPLSNAVFALAKNPTIFETSVDWKNQTATAKLLEQVPAWQDTTIKEIFSYFKQTQNPHTGPSPEHNKGHVDFVNVNWGPISNPYAKLQRPARLFVFVGDHPVHGEPDHGTHDNYFIASVIKNLDDHQYYVFESGASSLMTIDYWMHLVAQQSPQNQPLRINICNRYATKPADICGKMPYESEGHYVHDDYIPEDIRATNQTNAIQAYRPPYQDWHELANLAAPPSAGPSTTDESVDWDNIADRNALLQSVAIWPNYSTIASIFKFTRDLRYFSDFKDPSFLRRITWLFPYDGCWSRAAAMIKDFFGPIDNPIASYKRPSKIFAFGNLCARTDNTVDGYAAWWFHMAPIVRDGQTNEAYVFDPAVDAHTPLSVATWIARITDRTGKCADSHPVNNVQISICNGYGVLPTENCLLASNDNESYAALQQMLLMKKETWNQIELGRDPKVVLGDSPPWLRDTQPLTRKVND